MNYHQCFFGNLETRFPILFFQIFTKILQTSIFPDSWKNAIISPVFKIGKTADIENYRPVSLLSLPSKIFERIVFIRLYDHYNKIFNKSQFGCRENRSTMHHLLNFLYETYKGIGKGEEIEIIFTDFSKAFDRVDHGILYENCFQQESGVNF